MLFFFFLQRFIMTNKAIIVKRVSTAEQGRSGLGLKAQQKACEEFCKNEGLEVIGTFEDQVSGKIAPEEREGLSKALQLSKKSGAKIVVMKLDRLSRKVEDIARLMNVGVPFVVVETPQATPFMLHVYSAIAEMERKTIGKRIKAALQVKKEELAKEGKKLGHENITTINRLGHQANRKKGQKTRDRFLPIIKAFQDEIRAKGLKPSNQRVADLMNERQIKTIRGGKWFPNTIRQLLRAQ